ncbi:preprotein translocase subunit Sec61beta [Candidatus Micrarchaeota archaeon]|nr:preprotein translocase subunit Sec61beta [Candidatus Micrarchaeota archaeon]
MAEGKISAPSSSTGIVRFYDVDSSAVLLDPKIVIGFSLLVIIIEVALQIFK